MVLDQIIDRAERGRAVIDAFRCDGRRVEPGVPGGASAASIGAGGRDGDVPGIVRELVGKPVVCRRLGIDIDARARSTRPVIRERLIRAHAHMQHPIDGVAGGRHAGQGIGHMSVLESGIRVLTRRQLDGKIAERGRDRFSHRGVAVISGMATHVGAQRPLCGIAARARQAPSSAPRAGPEGGSVPRR